jgi:hypothetical protein
MARDPNELANAMQSRLASCTACPAPMRTSLKVISSPSRMPGCTSTVSSTSSGCVWPLGHALQFGRQHFPRDTHASSCTWRLASGDQRAWQAQIATRAAPLDASATHLHLLHEARGELLAPDADTRALAVVAVLEALLVVQAEDLHEPPQASGLGTRGRQRAGVHHQSREIT